MTEHLRKNYWAAVISLIGGLFAGWVDMHNNEVQAAVFVVLVISGIAGVVQPRGAWKWGLFTVAGLFASYLFAAAFHIPLMEWPQPNIFALSIAIVPAMTGAYGGSFVRRGNGKST